MDNAEVRAIATTTTNASIVATRLAISIARASIAVVVVAPIAIVVVAILRPLGPMGQLQTLNRTAVAKEYADFRLFAGFDNRKSVLRIRIRRISIILPDTDPYFFHEFGSRSDPRP